MGTGPGFSGKLGLTMSCRINSKHSRKLGLDKPVPRDPTLFLQQDSVTEHLIQSVFIGIY